MFEDRMPDRFRKLANILPLITPARGGEADLKNEASDARGFIPEHIIDRKHTPPRMPKDEHPYQIEGFTYQIRFLSSVR